MATILHAFRTQLHRQLAIMPFWLRVLAIYVWPAVAVFFVLGMTAANGRYAARKFGRGVARQAVDQMRLAFSAGMPPQFYYLYEMHEAGKRSAAGEYIHRRYLKPDALYDRLYDLQPGSNAVVGAILRDKMGFNRFCVERVLPTPRVYAVADGGAFAWTDGSPDGIPECSLFIKRQTGRGGKGAERWDWRSGTFAGPQGRRMGLAELRDHVLALSRRAPQLVQESIDGHRDLRDLTGGALSTLRMYTVRDEQGEPEHVYSMFRMSQVEGCVVDNVHRGGIAAAVDADTGILGKATDSGRLARTGWLDRHPVSGGRIAGRVIPHWREAVDLSLRAHREVGPAVIVGWDVAITDRGPVLIEGNKSPDIEIEQRLDGPWGNRRFGALLAWHLTNGAGNTAPR